MPEKVAVLLFWMAVAAVLLLLHFWGALPYLEFNRALILEHGQWWRIWTGNWVHLSNAHVLMDTAFMALVALFLVNRTQVWEGLVLVLLVPLGVGLGLLFFVPSVGRYAGFSGVDQGLLSYALIRSWSHDRLLFSVFLVAQFLRLGYEHSPFYNPYYMYHALHAVVAYQAHTFGALAGVCCWLAVLRVRSDKSCAEAAG